MSARQSLSRTEASDDTMTLGRYLLAAMALGLGLAACGDAADPAGKGGGRPGGGPSVVTAAMVAPHDFIDAIEAIGTAYARESVVITANVTERVRAMHFQDGAFVNRGAVLVEMATSEEAADLSSARAHLRDAQSQLDRVEELARQGYATRSSLDEQRATRDAARAAIQSIQARVADRVIRAPFSGVVGLRRVSPGLVVSAGDPIISLSDVSQIKLDFTVPETFAGAVKVGQPIRATTTAYPDRVYQGSIEGIDPQVDAVTRSIQVRAIIDNADRTIKPGMLLSARIVRQVHTALAVPEQAVTMEGDRHFVYRIEPQTGTAFKTRVSIGRREPGFVELTAGIGEGARVVADGVIKVRDGGQVRVLGDKPMSASGNAASPPAVR